MDSFIEDTINTKEPKYILDYIEYFGQEPNIIGMFWNNQEQLILNIEKAIKDNKPYNEYELLSDEEKKAFDSGELFF